MDCSFSGILWQQWDSRSNVQSSPTMDNQHSYQHKLIPGKLMVIHNLTCNALGRKYSLNSVQWMPSPDSIGFCQCILLLCCLQILKIKFVEWWNIEIWIDRYYQISTIHDGSVLGILCSIISPQGILILLHAKDISLKYVSKDELPLILQ